MEALLTTDSTGMTALNAGLLTVGQIAIILAGAFPMVEFLKKRMQNRRMRIAEKAGLDKESVAGMLASTANSIATFTAFGNMNAKGKLVNAAFAVSAAFIFGDHLGYTAAVSEKMILPLLTTKAVGGILALLAVLIVGPWLLKKTGYRDEDLAEKGEKG